MDDWVWDSGSPFQTTSKQEIIRHYVANDLKKAYLTDRQPLDVAGMGDVDVRKQNGYVWMLRKASTYYS